MEYTVIVDNRSYDLPKKTIGIMEKLDEVLKVDSKPLSMKQKYQKIFDFAKLVLGNEVIEIFGSDKVTDIDVGELELLVLKIQDSYNQPIAEYQNEKFENSLGSIPTDKIKAITEAAQAIDTVSKTK